MKSMAIIGHLQFFDGGDIGHGTTLFPSANRRGAKETTPELKLSPMDSLTHVSGP